MKKKKKEENIENINENEKNVENVDKDKKNKECSKKVKKSKKEIKNKLQEEIEDLKQQLADSEEKNLRIRAEYDNYRKRAAREAQIIRDNAKVDTITPILQVYDHFKMAVNAAETSDDMEVIKEGMEMIHNEFKKSMENLGISEIHAIGEKFDPNKHEALAKEPSEEDENIIIKQWQTGYVMNGKLLRPATVVVSSGPATDDEESE